MSRLHRGARRAAHALALTAGLTLTAGLAAPAAVAADSAAVITGVVRAVGGAPLAGVDVQAQLGFDVPFTGSVTTGRDGTYRIRVTGRTATSGVQVQFFAARATGGTSATGYADACYQGPALCQPDGPTITVTPGTTTRINVTLGPASVLGGRVVDALGRGVGGLRVIANINSIASPARATRPDHAATTDVNGNWSFGRVNPLGYYVLYGSGVSRPVRATPAPYGYSGLVTSTSVAAGQVASLRQSLVGGGALLGRVVDQAGTPVADATVSIPALFGQRDQNWNDTTDANGRFAITDLPAGSYPVCVSAPGYSDPCGPDSAGNVRVVEELVATTVRLVVTRTS